jgi:hypothetical protein
MTSRVSVLVGHNVHSTSECAQFAHATLRLPNIQFSWWLFSSSEFWCYVDSSVEVTVSEKHTVSIFRAEVAVLGWVLRREGWRSGPMRDAKWGGRRFWANRWSASRRQRGRGWVECRHAAPDPEHIFIIIIIITSLKTSNLALHLMFIYCS